MNQHRKMMRCFMNGKSCIYERAIDERIEQIKSKTGDKKAFVLMPFSPHTDAIYRWQIVPFLRSGSNEKEEDFKYIAERADEVRQVGYIICEKICRKIQEANLIVADISYNNPNVFYELGISVALGKPILLLCLDQVKNNRGQELRQYFGISNFLEYPSFGPLKGKISSNLINDDHFRDFDQISGKRLVVLHDGKFIESSFKSSLNMKYSFASLCLSAAATSIDQIFDSDNLNRHPELKRYSDASEYRKMTEMNLGNTNYENVINALKNCYCALIDTSSDSPAAFFWLGYMHAIGGFAIPINMISMKNAGTNDEHRIAFDVRALWHIYFDKDSPNQLADSLKNILEFVFIEKSKYLQRDEFWKKILKDNKVSIFLGSLNIPELGRNTIGDWDYRTAAELTSFLSSAKETMEVTLESPIQKAQNPDEKHQKLLQKQLEKKNCIIIASSDVNDLTEVAMAALWKKEPFCPLKDDDANFNGFIAYKSYQNIDNMQMSQSAFFRYETSKDPKRGFLLRQGDIKTEKEILEHHYDPDNEEGRGVNFLLGQLIVAPNPFPHSNDKWVIIISGISGPATLGIAQMLTGCIYSGFTVNKLKSESEKDFNRLSDWINNKENRTKLGIENLSINPLILPYDIMSEQKLEVLNSKIKKRGLYALISVGVYYPQLKQFHDERKIVAWNFTEIPARIGVDRENPSSLGL